MIQWQYGVPDHYSCTSHSNSHQSTAIYVCMCLDFDTKCMDFVTQSYGLWGMRGLWVMGCKFLQTKLVDPKFYGIRGSMGYEGYELRGR